MSGQELARHLNRNGFLTSAGVEYRGKRGIYRLIGETCRWANETFESPEEARRISDAFVKSDGAHAVSASE